MSKILVLHYFGGAGGKFITNCLAFSGQVAFPNFTVASEFAKNKDIGLIEQHMMATIPTRENSKQWLNLEQGCHQLFGTGIVNIKDNTNTMPNTFYNLDQFDNMWLPIQTHCKSVFDNVCNYFSNHTVYKVLLQSRPTFIDHAIRLKWPEQHHCLDLSQLDKFNQEIEKINVIFNKGLTGGITEKSIKDYILSQSYTTSSFVVSVGGLSQTYTVDYTFDSLSNTLSFVSTPPSQSNVTITAFINSTSGSVGSITGSLLGNATTATTASYAIKATVIPDAAPDAPVLGSIYFDNNFIYVYTGVGYKSASLN